jgi:hypothetical protein
MKKIILLTLGLILFYPSIEKVFAYTDGLVDGKPVFVGSILGEGTNTSVLTDRNSLTKYSVGIGEMISYKFDAPMTITHHQIRSDSAKTNLEFYDADKNLIKIIVVPNHIKAGIVPVKNVTYIAYRNTSGVNDLYWDLDIYGIPSNDSYPNLLLGKNSPSYRGTGVVLNASNPSMTDGNNSTFNSIAGASGYILYDFDKAKDIKQIFTSMLNDSKFITYYFYSDLARTNLVGTYNNPTTIITNYYTTDLLYENIRSVKIVSTSGVADNAHEFALYGTNTNIYFPVLSLSETHNHNSVDLTWTNPNGPQFTEILIKQNGILIATLPKIETTYKAIGLSLNSSYTYDVIAKYDDGGLSPITSLMATTDATGPTYMNVAVNPGLFRISHFTNVMAFEGYEIGTQSGNVKLISPFSFSIEDFSGSWNGWNITLKVEPIENGGEQLKDASLEVNCLNSKLFDADEVGSKIGTGVPINGTFMCNNGSMVFGSSYPLLSAGAGIDSSAKHIFEYPIESLNLSFSNEIKTGVFTGETTLSLITGP